MWPDQTIVLCTLADRVPLILTNFEWRYESKVEVKGRSWGEGMDAGRKGGDEGRERRERREGGPARTFVRRPQCTSPPDSHRFPSKMRVNLNLIIFPRKVKVHVKVNVWVLKPWWCFTQTAADEVWPRRNLEIWPYYTLTTAAPTVGNLEIDSDHLAETQLCKIQSDPQNSSEMFVWNTNTSSAIPSFRVSWV